MLPLCLTPFIPVLAPLRKLAEKARYKLTDKLCGPIVPVTRTAVVFGRCVRRADGASFFRAEVFDWKQGKLLRSLDCGAARDPIRCAMLSDGLIAIGNSAGEVRIGAPDEWFAAKITKTVSAITAVVSVASGAFATVDVSGTLRLWDGSGDSVVGVLHGCDRVSYSPAVLAHTGEWDLIVAANHTSLATVLWTE